LSYQRANWHIAADLYSGIIARNPDFAPAFSGLAQLYNTAHLKHPGLTRDPERTRQALDYALEAVRIDPVDSRSQLCLGWSFAMAGQYEQAKRHYDLAYELNDTDPWTCISSSLGLGFCGAGMRGRTRAEAGLRTTVAPSRTHWGFLCVLRFLAGDYEGSIASAEMAQGIIPNVPAWHAAALSHVGRDREAAEVLRRYLEHSRKDWDGTEAPSDEAITKWLLHLFPIAYEEDWRRLRDGLGRAGAPVSAAHYSD
jgi:tetratricopeptide (TPR) repeat protein